MTKLDIVLFQLMLWLSDTKKNVCTSAPGISECNGLILVPIIQTVQTRERDIIFWKAPSSTTLTLSTSPTITQTLLHTCTQASDLNKLKGDLLGNTVKLLDIIHFLTIRAFSSLKFCIFSQLVRAYFRNKIYSYQNIANSHAIHTACK